MSHRAQVSTLLGFGADVYIELLVAFFAKAQLALAPRGAMIVTLFEGEPYTLWNIRDLARHSGLQVERSFKFQARAYPGYHHARTLGVVKGKNGETGAGWKGENRPARSYIFTRKGEPPLEALGMEAPKTTKKRKRGSENGREDEVTDVEDDITDSDMGKDEDDNDD